MNPKHKNPRELRPGRFGEFWAHAPYNFVPLPEKIVTVERIPDQDCYTGYSGYIDCTLTTRSPLYTRAALPADLFEKIGDKPFHELTPDQQRERAQFFAIGGGPVIPGSSLRGMTRALVEIVGYGKTSWVTDQPLVFRAVGDTTSLGMYYRNRLMKDDGGNRYTPLMRAGFMEKKGSRWFIRPAQTIGGTTFGRIFKDKIPNGLKNWGRSRNAQEIWVKVGAYAHQKVRGFIQTKFMPVLEARASRAPGFEQAVLARAGDVPRKMREAVIFPPDPSATPIPVDDDLVIAYREQITQGQEKLLGKDGALVPGQPVFYLEEKGKLTFFGHVMLFRLPYERSPRDFVPRQLRPEDATDLADALFGFVPENNQDARPARAGRVFFQDADLDPGQTDIWLADKPITPKILGSPKPTTFQHYITQQEPDEVDSGKRTKDGKPKMELRLDHYASPPPHSAVIRGHKLYWHKGEVKPEDIIEGNQARIAKAKTQYTQIMPVKSGVTFHFRIYFENLTDVELGALLWVLRLPPRHLHKIGMGKPLGMGSVEIKPTLHLLDRASRYKWLFDRRGWFEGDPITALESDFVQAFEGFVLRLMDTKEKGTATCLAEVERIQTLLKMLEGDGPVSAADRDLLEYMEIEHGPGRVNEYKERPVLPDPLHTMRPTRRGRPAPASKPTQPH